MLWRLWRNEREDPQPFYELLAAMAVEDLDTMHGPIAGQTIVDLLVPHADAAVLAARAATGNVSLVLDSRER